MLLLVEVTHLSISCLGCCSKGDGKKLGTNLLACRPLLPTCKIHFLAGGLSGEAPPAVGYGIISAVDISNLPPAGQPATKIACFVDL